MSSVVPLRSSSCQSPDLVLPRPFPSVLTTRAFDHSRRRWFGTCSCQPVPRGPPRPFALVAHSRRHSAPVWHSPTALVHRPDETACRTNAGTSSPVEVRSPRLAAFPVLSGSPYPVRHFLRPVPQLGSPTTSGSVSIRSGPPLASADKPSACHAESNRSSPSGPRHTPPENPLSDEYGFPPAPDAPSDWDGTHRNNLQSRLQRSAPESTGLPSAPPAPALSGFREVSSFRWPSVCRRGALVAACRFSFAGLPESLQQTRLRPLPALRSVRSKRRPRPVRHHCHAPASILLPVCPADRSGRTTRRTGTSVPASPSDAAFVSAKRVSPPSRRYSRLSVAVLP